MGAQGRAGAGGLYQSPVGREGLLVDCTVTSRSVGRLEATIDAAVRTWMIAGA